MIRTCAEPSDAVNYGELPGKTTVQDNGFVVVPLANRRLRAGDRHIGQE